MTNNINYKNIQSVLFVCMGNICRSPTAEAVFRHKIAETGIKLDIDSCGTIGAHAKELPDHRAQKAGTGRGYCFDNLKARKVTKEDFEKFDLILAMDNDNLRDLMSLCPEEYRYKIKLMLSYGSQTEFEEVPDPYYGGAKGFELVLDLVEDASDGIVKKILGKTR